MIVSEQQRYAPIFPWRRLICAALLSAVLPGWGGRYLGMTPSDGRARRYPSHATSALTVCVGAIILFLFWAQNFDFNQLILFTGVWVSCGLSCACREWRWALKNPESVKVTPLKTDTSLIGILVWIPVVVFLLNQGATFPTFFLAPNDTPLIKAGDILYGFDYDSGKMEIGRGQLVVANIDSKPRLVRVMAIPGDILGIEPYALRVNGSVLKYGVSERSGRSSLYQLQDLANTLANPGQRWADLEIIDNSAELSNRDATILHRRKYIVASDADLLTPRQALLHTTTISSKDIVIVPWAKLEFLGRMPGSSSSIAQPVVVLQR